MKLAKPHSAPLPVLAALTLAVVALIGYAGVAEAATCFTCHAPIGQTSDLRPAESTYRNITTGSIRGSHAKHIPATTDANACTPCHGPLITNTNHRNGFINVTSAASSLSYSKGASFPQSGSNNLTLGSCSTATCHNNVYGPGKIKTPVWGDTAANCTACHTTPIGATGPATGSHITTTGHAVACTTCHAIGTSATAMPASGHNDGDIDIVNVGYPANGAKHAAGSGYGSCSATYCHSSGQSADGSSATPVYAPITWGSGATNCTSCHGGTTTLTTGSHTGHLTANTNCSNCHSGATTTSYNAATHMNGSIDVGLGSYTAGGAPGNGYGTCASSLCHGNLPSPVWGNNTANATCTKCHGVLGITPAAYTANANTAAPGYNGTGRALSGATAVTDKKVGAHDVHLRAWNAISSPIACTECHANVSATSAAFTGHMNGAADVNFGTLAKSGAGATPGYNDVTGTCSNTYCHFGRSIGSYAPATANASVTWKDSLYLVGSTADCQKCHASPPSTTGIHAGKAFPASCNSCHSHVSIAGVITDSTLHINGVVDGGGVSSGGSPCYGCHSMYNVMNGSAASFHHVLDDASPDQAPNTGTYPSSQTVLACTSCHTDHNYFNANKGANLRTSYNAVAGTINNHDFDATAPSYGLCVSCHSTAQTKGTAQAVAGSTSTIAIDGSATGYQASMHNYTSTSLFGTSKFSANCVKCHSDEQTKDKQTSTNKFGTHFSVQRSLLNPMGSTPQAAAGADFCYRCHSKTSDVNPGGGTAKSAALKDYFGSKAMTAAAENIFSEMQLANRHNISSYKGLHKDDETRAGIAAAKHVECTDCHDPHLAKSGNHTAGSATLAGVLTGAAGVGVTTWGANWAGVAATAYNPSTTTVPLISATAEWQVCFKCHSGANANITTWGGTGAAAFTDLALEFNPNNASGHPVVAALPVANRLTAARLTGGWTPGSVMTCSDCHATDSTASKGPHGSSVKWMLAGTNKAWPYTTTTDNGTSTGTTLYRLATYNTGAGTANGLFCLNCHTIRPATGSNSWHSNSDVTGGEHGGNAIMACASCHLRVPHGGKISRLLQTTGAPARYRSNGSTATSSWDFWGTSTVNIKGSTFSSGNFNSSCGQHNSGGTGGEAW